MWTREERYQMDPVFNKLVEAFYDHMKKGLATPSDIREALLVASLKIENERTTPVHFPGMEPR